MRDLGDEHEPDEGAGDAGPPAASDVPVRDLVREREERFRAIAEHARDAIAEVAADGRILYVTPGFVRTFGHPAEAVVGRNAAELVHPEDAVRLAALCVAAGADAGVPFVLRARHASGSWLAVEASARVYRGAAGDPRAVVVCRDVTDRTRAEGALERQLEVERRIAEISSRFLNVAPAAFEACMHDGLASVARLAHADRARFVVVSPSQRGLSEQYQWSAEGMPRRPRITDCQGDIERFRWSAQRLWSGEVLHLPRIVDLPPEAAAERESFEADGVTAYLGLPIRHEGRPVGFLDFARGPLPRERDGWDPAEISRLRLVAEVFGAAVRRRQLELDLARQIEVEKRLGDFSRELLEQGACEVDVGIERGLEAAAAFVGADRAYLVAGSGGAQGVAVYDWHAPGVPPRPHPTGPAGPEAQRWVVQRLARGEPVRLARVEEVPEGAAALREQLIADGVRSLLCLPIRAEGRLDAVLGFHWLEHHSRLGEGDLSVLQLMAEIFGGALRRKRAELRLRDSQQQLSQAQKMEALGTLAGGIAHDFNNQLTVMLANARFAMRHLPPDDEVARALVDLHRAAQHCAQLTRGLLAFSRRTTASPRSLEVSAVVEEVEELLRPLIPSSIDFQIVDRQADARVVADPVQLQQVIVNLVVNARDAMPEGGRLTLAVSTHEVDRAESLAHGIAAGRYVELAVSDTGVGIDPLVLPRIFEPFFTTKEPGKGTGLGLATCYGIVQECGGAIAVQSERGRGATFRVLLPESRSAAFEAAADAPGTGPRGRGAVLVVEDEAGVRRALARALREGGYEVVEAGDGGEALELATGRRFDALVTDVDMPRLGGVELARRVEAGQGALPVLFVSGTAVEALQSARGPVARCRFLGKPFSDAALLDALHGLLVERRSSR
jgi:PAS domain S-box-containing protein